MHTNVRVCDCHCMRPHLIRNFTSLKLIYFKWITAILLTCECKKKNLDVKSDTVFPSSQQLSFGTRKVSARAQQDTERGREKNKKKKQRGRERAEAICDVIF